MPDTLPPPSEAVETQFPLLMSAETPDVQHQFEEFQRSGGLSSVNVQRDRNDRIRYNRWNGRTNDYRKHREALNRDPIPWEDAWDGRVYLVDNIIQDLGDVLSSAFRRAQFKARPSEVSDIPKKPIIENILQKYREKMTEITDEAEYLWQYSLSNGAAIWQVGWERCIAMKMTPIGLDALIQAAQQAQMVMQSMPPQEVPPEIAQKIAVLGALGQVITDPGREEEAAELLILFARDLAAQLYAGQRKEYGDDFLLNYRLSKKVAKKAVRHLREEGSCELPSPYLSKNQPYACAREVGYDYFCPPEMTNVQAASWHAVREWLTPEELMAKRATDGWDSDWVDEAIKTAGETSLWSEADSQVAENDTSDWQTDSEIDTYDWRGQASHSGLVEVIHFYKRYISEEGIPEIWCTVWNPHVLNKNGPDGSQGYKAGAGTFPLYAIHYRHEELPDLYPFVGYRWQKKKRSFIHSVGVPQLSGSDQHSVKTSLDMLVDRQEMEVNPPWAVSTRMGMRYKAGPGSQIDFKRSPNEVSRMHLEGGNPELAFKLIEAANKRISEYYGLMNELVLPAKWQSKLQSMTEGYLSAASQMWSMVLKLIQRYPEEAARIAGTDPQLPMSPEDIAGEYDISLYFDVRDLDIEFVFKKLEAVINMAGPSDKEGLLDWGNVTRLIMSSIDPTYATALLADEGAADQKLFKNTREQLSLVMQGNLPDLVEEDPTAKKKLEIIQQLIATNPVYQEAAQNQHVRGTLDVWLKNLEQSVAQQQNAQTGRYGVDVGATMAEA